MLKKSVQGTCLSYTDKGRPQYSLLQHAGEHSSSDAPFIFPTSYIHSWSRPSISIIQPFAK